MVRTQRIATRRTTAEDRAIDIHVGGRIRLRRRSLGMSQDTLAEKIGVTFQQVSKYQDGDNRVAASRLYDLACALDVPISYFFEGLPATETGSAADQDPMKASRAVEIVLHFDRIFAADDATGGALLALIRHMSGGSRALATG